MPGRADGLVVREVQDGADAAKRREDRRREQDLEHAHVGPHRGGSRPRRAGRRVRQAGWRSGGTPARRGARCRRRDSRRGRPARRCSSAGRPRPRPRAARLARSLRYVSIPPSSAVQSVTSRTRISRRPPPRRRARPRGWRARPRGSGSSTSAPRTRATKARSADGIRGIQARTDGSWSRSRAALSSGRGARGCRCHASPLCRSILIVPSAAGELEHVLLRRAQADLDLALRPRPTGPAAGSLRRARSGWSSRSRSRPRPRRRAGSGRDRRDATPDRAARRRRRPARASRPAGSCPAP